MKAMVCEMCSGNDIVKDGDFFVCQSCGTKYTVEAARKLMIEGTVDVSGSSVKIDKSKEINNLYLLARRACTDQKWDDANRFFEKILIEDSQSLEAIFCHTVLQHMKTDKGIVSVSIFIQKI